MKLLMVTPSFFPIVGGTESVVQNLTFELNARGIQTDIVTFNMNEKWNPIWREETKENGFKVTRLPAFNVFQKIGYNPIDKFFGVNVIPKLTFAKMFKDYDILHFHDDVDLSFSLFSCFMKKPRVFHCHTLAFSYGRFKTAFFSRKLLKKAGHSYVCVSNFTRNLLADLGIPISRIFVSHNAVDIKKFRPVVEKKLDNMLLFVGRPEKRKGLQVLLDSLKYLDIPVQLKVVGSKPNSGQSGQSIKAERQKLGIHEIEWLGGVDEKGLIDWYQKAAVFVCPSLWEDFPVVTLEALSCGTPVVASRVGGISEVVRDNISGLLVPPNNPEELAFALRKLLKGKKLRETLGRNGRQIIEEDFSWSSAANRIVKIYQETLSSAQ